MIAGIARIFLILHKAKKEVPTVDPKRNFFQSIAKLLTLVMILQGLPLWQLSQAYQWHPARYLDAMSRLVRFLGTQPVEAAVPEGHAVATGAGLGGEFMVLAFDWNDATVPMPGDLDGDCDVDTNDLEIILEARNTPSSGPDDPRDLDGDGMITVLDGRRCVLICTRPRCMVEPYQVNVPNVVTMTQDAAATAIEAAGLTVGGIVEQESETIPEGSVIGQSRAAGSAVAPGCEIHLLVSEDTTPNVAPTANAGPDQSHTLAVGQLEMPVTLDGTGSTDPDGEVVSCVWTGSPDPADTLQSTLNLQAGTYTFSLVVTDNEGAESQPDSMTVTIEALHPPVITSTPVTTATEDQPYSYDVEASDQDVGDTLTFSLDVAPTNMTIDPTTGLTQWSPGNPDVGSHPVTVRVVDPHGLFDTQSFEINVLNVNDPPEIVPIQDQEMDESATLNIPVSGSDVDGDPLTLSASGLPPFASLTDNGDGTGSISLTPSFDDAGQYPVTVTVSDGELIDSDDFLLQVTNVNRAPTANAGGPYEVEVGESIDFDGSMSNDPDGDPLTYLWNFGDGSPEASGVQTSHTYSGDGTYNVTLTVDDGQGGQDTHTTTAVVNLPPDMDLQPVTMDVSGVAVDPQTLEMSGSVLVEIRNNGTTDISEAHGLALFEDTNRNQTLDIGSDQVLGSATIPDGPSGGSVVTISVEIGGIAVFAGNLIYAFVDAEDRIDETNEDNNITHSMADCEYTPPVGEFDPVLEWEWTETAVNRSSVNVMCAPAVANLTDDNADGRIDQKDIPDLVFNTFAGSEYNRNGTLRAISGDGSGEWFTITDYETTPGCSPAVGDIDGDGIPEIITVEDYSVYRETARVLAFDNYGHLKWASDDLTFSYLPSYSSLSIADIDSDGNPEVVVGNTVLRNDGSTFWIGAEACNVVNSTVADLDLDGRGEIIDGNTIYDWNGDILWHDASMGDGFAAVANFDSDPFPEIVQVAAGYVYLLEGNGDVIWGPIDLPPAGFNRDHGGPPTIADYDNDGEPEIGVAGGYRYVVFESDGSVKWTRVTQDTSSNRTGSSVFDFDGDGSAEVVYSDERYLRIYRGTDGAVLFQEPIGSGTLLEFPLVVDVDNDNNAEIVVPSNWYRFGPKTGIQVFGDANDTWVNTRNIWNQHAYSITNINDDGSIPQSPVNNWEVFNNFRCNQSVDALACVDLTASYVRVDTSACPNGIEVMARIGNGGALHVAPGIQVALYDDDPAAGGSLLATTLVEERIDPSAYVDVEFTSVDPLKGLHTLYVVADDDGSGNGLVREIDEQNNKTWARFVLCGNPPTIISSPVVSAQIDRVYNYDVEATDPDVDDVLSFSLDVYPAGMSIDPTSGLIEWTPDFSQIGDYPVVVIVEDLEGLSDEQSFSIFVEEVNNAPELDPIQDQVMDEGGTLNLPVSGSDLDGDPLTLSASGLPSFASLADNGDGTGTITCSPGFEDAGQYPVTVTLSDGELTASDDFLLQVTNINRAPTANAGGPYEVEIGNPISFDGSLSSDPDGDPLTYVWDFGDGSPEATGMQVSYTYSEGGTYSATLAVDDGQGGQDSDTTTATVNAPTDFDLEPTAMDVSGVTVDPQTLEMSGSVLVEVRNNGSMDIPDAYELTLFEDTNRNQVVDVGSDQVLGTAMIADGPAGGSTIPVSIDTAGTAIFAGNLVYAFVDSGDQIEETNEDNNITHSMAQCEYAPPVGEFDPVLEWEWTGSEIYPGSNLVMSAPVVGNLNDDNGDGEVNQKDIPDIIFNSFDRTVQPPARESYYYGGRLRAISGNGLGELFTVSDYETMGGCTPAIADIDGDGLLEIVVVEEYLDFLRTARILAFENDGTFKWASEYFTLSRFPDSPSISIADIDSDNSPEIIMGSVVLESDGSTKWYKDFNAGWPVAIAVADIQLDGTQEILMGNIAYDHTGAVVWQNSSLRTGFTAVANFDADPTPEIVLVADGYVYMSEGDGQLVWGPVDLPPNGTFRDHGGPPTIADFDNDGVPEIGIAGGYNYVVFEPDGSVLWTSPTQDLSSNATGSTVFDFDGDGAFEVVYADEVHLRIYNGIDGQILFEEPIGSGTLLEQPLVVDVDNDNNAEIVVASNYRGPRNGIQVFGDANDTWVNTRNIWNQHAYSITNVNEDGSIPQSPVNNWEIFNNFRCNQSVDALACVDLTTSYVRVDTSTCSSDIEVTARIGNGGALHVAPGIQVALYDDDPAAGGSLLATTMVEERIDPGAYVDVEFTSVDPLEGLHTLYVVADDDGSGAGLVREIDEQNNRTWARFVLCGDGPSIMSLPVTDGVLCEPYSYDVEATDPEPGDVLTYSLDSAPEGMVIDEDTGLVQWSPVRGQGGGHFVAIRVEDTRGEYDIQEFAIAVEIPEGTFWDLSCDWSDEVNPNGPWSYNQGPGSPIATHWDDWDPTSGCCFYDPQPAWAATQWPERGHVPVWLKVVSSVPTNMDTPMGSVLLHGTSSYSSLVSTPAGVEWTSPVDGLIQISGGVWHTGKFIGRYMPWTLYVNGGAITDGELTPSDPYTSANPFEFGAASAGPGVLTLAVATGDVINLEFREESTYLWFAGVDMRITLLSTPENDPPFITSDAATSAREGRLYTYDVEALDPDLNDTLTFSLHQSPSGMTIDPDSGLIEWTPIDTQVGENEVVVAVGDAGGLSGTQAFDISVTALPPDRGPTITSAPPTSGIEGELFTYEAIATDCTPTCSYDGLQVHYAFNGNAEDETGNGHDGTVHEAVLCPDRCDYPDSAYSFDGANDFIEADATGLPTAERTTAIWFYANRVDTKPFLIAYGGNGGPPGTSHGLNINGSGAPAIIVGNHYGSFNLSYYYAEPPVGEWMHLAATTDSQGTNIFLNGEEVASNGIFINNTYVDGRDLALGVFVDPQGNAPYADSNVGYFDGLLDEARIYDRALSEEEIQCLAGQLVTFSLEDAPTGMTIDPLSGLVEWIPDSSQTGAIPVTIRVEDGDGLSDTQSFVIHVGEVNHPPSFTSTPVTTATEDELYVYDVAVTDPDVGDVLTISMTAGPQGMTIDPATGDILWTPENSQVGDNPVTLRVEDSGGLFDTQSFAINVINVNDPPVISSIPPTTAAEGSLYTYDVEANDPDLGDVPTFSLDVAPSGMTIDPTTGLIQWTPEIAQVGDNPVTVRVQDTAGLFDTQSFTIAVIVDTIPPEATVFVDPVEANPDEIFTIYVGATDNTEVSSLGLTVNGSPLALDGNNQAIFSSSTPGLFVAMATAMDPAGNVGTASQDFRVLDPSDTEHPTVSLDSPEADSEITLPTQIFGTANDDNLEYYALELSPRGKDEWTEFARGMTSVVANVLGTFDPTMLLNGLYDVRLTAKDVNGLVSRDTVVYRVTEDLKVGNFTITLQDLSIPVAGIPITVNRTYDSRDKGSHDFGYGWSIDIQNVKVEESRVLGESWEQTASSGMFPTYCVEPVGGHYVSITLPDGRTEEFDATLTPDCMWLQPFGAGFGMQVGFSPRPGTFSSLEPVGASIVWATGGLGPVELWYPGTLTSFDPSVYRLTTPEGMVYVIDQAIGIKTVTDPNGNTLTYGPDGILHSAGKDIEFTRDAQGRITEITDPNGGIITYEYDSNGDLIAVTDQVGNTTRYTYNSSHGLVDIEDPRGITPARNEYDDTGRLVAHIDAFGNRIEYTHDIDGRQEIVQDRLGNMTVYEYDEEGNVTSQTDPLGHVTSYTYDAEGNKLSETDPLGNETTYTYDLAGNLLTQTDPLGNITTYTYNSRNQVLATADPNGNTTTNTYDSNGNLLTTTDPLNNTTSNTYDSSGNLLTTTNCLDNVTSYAYDSYGNLTRQTDALGNDTTYTYDSNGNQLTQTTTRTTDSGPVTMTTTYEYDTLNRLIRTIDPDGYESVTEYNAIGKKSATLDKNGNRTEYEYDLMGNLITTTYPDGATETAAFDANGNRESSADRAGRITTYEYDAANRLTRTIYPDGAETSTLYNEAGRMISTFDENGNATSYGYDIAGRRTSVTDALGQVTSFGYDFSGNQLSMTDANGNTTSFQYDELNRRVRTIFPDGTSTETGYDCLGRRISETDQAGITTEFDYDALGRLTKVTDALGGETSYTYDEVGNKLTQTDPNGHTTSWAYDDLRRATEHTLPLGMSSTFTYDPNGNLLTKTDFNGNTTTYAYDVCCGRLLSKTYPDTSEVTFTYTPSGQRETVTDSRGATTYTYDLRDRVLSVSNPDGSTLTYAYDARGNRTSVSIPSGTTSYAFDELNRLETVTDPDSGVSTYTYDAVGNRASVTYPNGTIAEYTYNSLNRLTYLENRKSTGEIISSYAYTLGPAGNRISVVEDTGRTVDYTYDALYRLTEEDITDAVLGNQTISYTYDAFGNRLTKIDATGVTSYTYDANDRLLTETTPLGTNTYGYDDNGNTVSKSDGTGTTTYTYDYENRLIGAVTPSSSIAYAYDSDGIRMSSEVDGVPTIFLVDKNRPYAQVLEERDGSSSLIVSYVHGDDLISQNRSGDVSYYHYDGQMSTRNLSQFAGTISDGYVFDAFGLLISRIGSTHSEYLYTGEQYDPNVGFYYLRARYYSQATGRFMNSDTWEGRAFDPRTIHKYVYSGNNPINLIDPSGEFYTFVELTVVTNIYSLMISYNLTMFSIALDVERIANRTLKVAYAMRDAALDSLMMSGGAEYAWEALRLARGHISVGYLMLARSIANNYTKFWMGLAIPVRVHIGPVAYDMGGMITGILDDPKERANYLPVIPDLEHWESILQYVNSFVSSVQKGDNSEIVVMGILLDLLDVLGKAYNP